MPSTAKIRGLGFILWQTRHEFYHVLLGLVWAWCLRELWQEFSIRWVMWAIVGSLVPDIDHILYFTTYGKTDRYTRQIRGFLRNRQWRVLWKFIATGHKYQTNLATHNVYFMLFLFVLSLSSLFYDWRTGLVLFGAMLIHYLFDILDDMLILGYVNPNWKRWGKPNGLKT